MKRILVLDPVNRLEGDLRVKLTIEDNTVIDAQSSGILFRGFERIMNSREPMDALVITPRICGICSVSHSVAAAKALQMSMGTNIPENGYLMKNLILGTEVVMSHLTHFYFLFGPDMTNEKYKKLSIYNEILPRFKTMKGISVLKALKARQSMLEIMGLVGGKWPNTLAIHPAGTTSTMNLSTKTRAIGVLQEFQSFLEQDLLKCPLEEWLDIDTFDRLEEWLQHPLHGSSDIGIFFKFSMKAGLDRLGIGPNRFLSYGSFEMENGTKWIKAGYNESGRTMEFDQSLIQEHIAHSFFRDAMTSRHPLSGVTVPFSRKKNAYSWTKAPRYMGKTVEVGPLARMIISNEPLIMDTMRLMGPSAFTRMFARLREMTLLTQKLSTWIQKIDPGKPFYSSLSNRYKDIGIGLTEAARGCLGHWVKIESKRIQNYQIITPSAWNMSPRDELDQPGPLEQALIGTRLDSPDNPIEVYHIIRSFDPCMSCTVH